MPRLPDEIRNKQNGCDGHGQRKARRAEEVAAPDEERRDQQDEGDGKRVLRLESDADGKPEQEPRA